jgi:hypothetical protein
MQAPFVLAANIAVAWKGLSGTNTLAYSVALAEKKKKEMDNMDTRLT